MTAARMKWAGLSALALALAVGCNSKSDSTSGQTLDASTTSDFTSTFLTLEQNASAQSVPIMEPQGGGAFALKAPFALPATTCYTTATVDNGNSTSTTTWTFTGACAGPEGGTLAGTIAFTYNPTTRAHYDVLFTNLVATKGTWSRTINGTRSLDIDAAGHTATETANLTVDIADTADASKTRHLGYVCNLNADTATAGHFKLSGTFAYTNNTITTSGSIGAATPLDWSAGCCYPQAGTLTLTQGNLSASVLFSLPCGTITISVGGANSTSVLSACPG